MLQHLLVLMAISVSGYCFAMTEGADSSIIPLPPKLTQEYLSHTSAKIERYTKRINDKTEKTLERLSRWESKIQRLLQKASPETASRLFANDRLSFKTMLAQYKKGETVAQGYKAQYDAYRDKLTTQLKYLDSNRNLLPKGKQQLLAKAKQNVTALDEQEQQNEALQKMIKERRQQLINEAIKYLGKNKYLQKINKEGWYYAETLKNYKQLFNEPGKAEETAKNILNKIPAFKEFMRKNSMLSSLFRMPDNSGSPQSLAGLQTRAGVNSLVQSRIAAGGPNAMAEVRQNLQAAQAELSKLKDKLLKGGGTSDTELPDFKPNTQKTKTFLQRVEYGFNLQFGKSNGWMPGTADIGLTAGYKLNDKSVIGIGAGYKLGLGSIEHIKFTHEGIGLRSYLDWKIPSPFGGAGGGFFISGGYELNHYAAFKNISALKSSDAWQQSGLIGLSKKVPLKTKFSKGTKLQLLYDFLYRQHDPVSQPWVFRVGYDLK